jgi:predicted amidohydrolase
LAESYRVAAVQMTPRLADVPANVDAVLGRFDEATGQGARLVVFPECALTGYGFHSKDEAWPYAESVPGPSLDRLATACARADAFMVVGFLERDRDRLFNACALLGPLGVVGSYRKLHLPYLGVDRFTDPGDRPFAVHDAGGLRVGLIICYDGSFPESGRVLTLLGADVLVLPTNWPTHSERAAEVMMATRALENVVYAVACNRVGEERGFQFIGRSSISGTAGETLAFASPDREEILYADVDVGRARNKRQVRVPGLHEINRLKDRRPQFYGPLLEGAS